MRGRRGGLIREEGFIDFLPPKSEKGLIRAGGLFERGSLIEDLRNKILAELQRARSGAPWVRKCGKLSIPENSVMT